MTFTQNIGRLALVLVLPTAVLAQKDTPIFLVNPSFEGTPTMSETPSGWYDCGAVGESAPDIQPGGFHVTKPASHGSTYLGMVVRDNETYESIAQRLTRPMEAGKCYEFSLDLCRAEYYVSLSRTTMEEVNYGNSVKLVIYGSDSYCGGGDKLYETPEITNTRWLTTTMRLKPKKNYTFIRLQAYYKTPVLFPYNGNVLVDNLSPIKPVPCVEKPVEKPVIAAKPPVRTGGPATVKTPGTKPPTVTRVEPAKPPAPPKTEGKLVHKNLKKGDVVRLEKVYFEANQYELKPESYSFLQPLYEFLKNNPDVVVEVGGHTNNVPGDAFAEELSTNRAKVVAEWLVSQGINESRVKYKGYGKKYPIEPNYTPEGRQKNQRVEIKILEIKKDTDK